MTSPNPSGMQLYLNRSAYTDIPYSGLRRKINSTCVKLHDALHGIHLHKFRQILISQVSGASS